MSKKAKFTEEQPAVKITEKAGLYYIHICLNGEWVEDVNEFDEIDRYWQCDFNEIVCEGDEIDVADVEANPEKYIDFVVVRLTKEEKLERAIAELRAEVAEIRKRLEDER